MYVDDATIFQKITSEVDAQHLQQTLTHLTTWSNTNKIKFNKSKCKVLTVRVPQKETHHLCLPPWLNQRPSRSIRKRSWDNYSCSQHNIKSQQTVGITWKNMPPLNRCQHSSHPISGPSYIAAMLCQRSLFSKHPCLNDQAGSLEQLSKRMTRWMF